MPAATEAAAPNAPAAAKQAAAKPTKKPAEGAAAKPPAKKKATETEKPVSAAPATPAGDKKKTEKKQTAPAADKKQTTPAAAKKQTTPAADKKQTTPAADKKKTTPVADKKLTTDTTDKKPPAPRRVAEEAVDEPVVVVVVPKPPVALPVLNTLQWASCAKLLENLLNFSPSLGAALAHLRPFKSTQHLVDQLGFALDALPPHFIEAFLKRFQELPLIPKSKLTKEHKCCVGLDKLTEEQVSELKPLYAQYREKFGFPFVVCAREAQASQLAVALRSRLLNDKHQELQAGRREVKKIARMRLLELVVA